MADKLKVGVIYYAPAPYRNPFLRRLTKRSDIDIKVIYLSKVGGTFDWHSDLTDEFPYVCFDVPDWLKYKNYQYWVSSEFRRYLKDEKFDAVYIGGYFPAPLMYAILWCLLNGVPYVVGIEDHNKGHKASPFRKFINKTIIQPLIKRAGAYVAAGSYARERIASWGIDPERVSIVLNAPDVELWIRETDLQRENKSNIRKELGIDDNPVLLFVGRMVPEKGVEDLIEAYGEVFKGEEFRDIHLLIIGEGPLLEPLKKRSVELGLKKSHFLGFVAPEKLFTYFAAADAFILPSRYEPFGVVVQEAAASRLPLLVSDCCGATAELLKDGENGLVFAGGNVAGIADAIKKLMRNKDKWERMGEESRKLALKYDYNHGEREFLKAIKTSLNAH